MSVLSDSAAGLHRRTTTERHFLRAGPDLLQRGNVVGIDTHNFMQVAALLDRLGRVISTLAFAATDKGSADLMAWFDVHSAPVCAGSKAPAATALSSPAGFRPPARVVVCLSRVDRRSRADRAVRAALEGADHHVLDADVPLRQAYAQAFAALPTVDGIWTDLATEILTSANDTSPLSEFPIGGVA